MRAVPIACLGKNANHHTNREGLYSLFWRIRFFVGTKLSDEAKIDFSEGVEAGIVGPQLGKPLAHRAEDVRNCRRSDAFTAGGNSSITISVGKNLEVGDRIFEVAEVGINVDLFAI